MIRLFAKQKSGSVTAFFYQKCIVSLDRLSGKISRFGGRYAQATAEY